MSSTTTLWSNVGQELCSVGTSESVKLRFGHKVSRRSTKTFVSRERVYSHGLRRNRHPAKVVWDRFWKEVEHVSSLLRLLMSSSRKDDSNVVHPCHECDVCQVFPIRGNRWRAVRPKVAGEESSPKDGKELLLPEGKFVEMDFDLCHACYIAWRATMIRHDLPMGVKFYSAQRDEGERQSPKVVVDVGDKDWSMLFTPETNLCDDDVVDDAVEDVDESMCSLDLDGSEKDKSSMDKESLSDEDEFSLVSEVEDVLSVQESPPSGTVENVCIPSLVDATPFDMNVSVVENTEDGSISDCEFVSGSLASLDDDDDMVLVEQVQKDQESVHSDESSWGLL